MFDKDFEAKVNATVARNLKHYLDINDMNQADLAKLMGVTTATTSNWCKGIKLPRMDKIDKMCSIFHINRSDLIEDHTEKSNVEPVLMGKTVRIPVYGRIPAGIPIEAIEDIEDYIDVPADLVKNNDIVALKVVGDSMYPKYLDGDYVVIRKQPDCESGQDCAVRVNDNDVTLKRVIKEVDGIMLQPINPEYAPKKYDYTDEFNPVYIIGVVIELRRKI